MKKSFSFKKSILAILGFICFAISSIAFVLPKTTSTARASGTSEFSYTWDGSSWSSTVETSYSKGAVITIGVVIDGDGLECEVYAGSDKLTRLKSTATQVATYDYTIKSDGATISLSGDGYGLGRVDITEILYSVVYNGNGNTSGEVETVSTLYAIGDSISLDDATGLAKTGSCFCGWSTNQSATSGNVGNYTILASDVPASGNVITFYAVWGNVITEQPSNYNAYKVTVNSNLSGTITYQWYKQVSGQSAVAISGATTDTMPNSITFENAEYFCEVYVNGTKVATSNHLTPITVTYNGNTDATGTAPNNQYAFYSGNCDKVALPANSFTKTGYRFIGWNKNSSATSGSTGNYFVSSSDDLDHDGTIVFYAIWSQEFSVTYVANTIDTVTGLPTDTTKYLSGEQITVNASATPARSGYKFLGWSTTDGATTVETFTDGKYTVASSNVIFYAVWQEKTTPTVNAPVANVLAYTGSAQTLVTAGSTNGGTLQYALGTLTAATETYSSTIPQGTNATTYYVWYRVVGNDDYKDVAEASVSVTIEKATTTISNLSITNWTYGGTANVPSANTNFGTIVYTYSNLENGTYSSTVPTNAGTYYVKASVAGTDNYLSDEEVISFEIAKATPTVTAPTAVSNLKYDATAKTLISAGSTNGGTLQYALGEVGMVTNEFSASLPQATMAGTYYVWYKVVGNDNYENVYETANSPVEVTITATYTVTYFNNETGTTGSVPTDSTRYLQNDEVTVLGGNLAKTGYTFLGWTTLSSATTADYVANDKFTMGSNDVTLNAVWQINTYTITYHNVEDAQPTFEQNTYDIECNVFDIVTPSKDGYTFDGWYTESTFVNKITQIVPSSLTDYDLYAKWLKDISITTTAQTYTYSGSSIAFSIAGATDSLTGFTVKYYVGGSWTETAPTDAGTYNVQVTRAKNGTYNAYDSEVINSGLVINKANPTLTTTPSAKTLTYTGSAQALVEEGSTNGGTLQYALGNSTAATETYSSTIPQGTSAATYYVWYKIFGDSNYNDSTADCISVTISPVKVTKPTADTTTFTYSGSEQTYSLATNSVYTISNNTRTVAGSQTVKVELNDKDNYVWDETTPSTNDLEFTFTISPAKVTKPTANTTTFTYSGSEQTYSLATNSVYTISNNTRTVAGSQTVKVELNDKDNYVWDETTPSTNDLEFTFTINKATQSITAISNISKTYDKTAVTAPTYTMLGDGIVSIEYKVKNADDNTYSTTAPTDVGNYVVRVSVAEGTNYLQGSNTSEFSIAQKEVSLDWSTLSASDLIYSGTAKTLTATAKGVVSGDTCTVSVELTEGKDNINVGTFTYTATALSNSNYILPTSVVSQECTITQKTLTITTTGSSKVYDGTALTNASYNVDGLVNSETVTVATTGTITNFGTTTNTYSIVWSGATAGNYSIVENLGTLEITKKTVTLTIVDILSDCVYSKSAKTTTATIEGLVGSDQVSYTLSYSDNINAGTCNVEIASASISSGLADNYTIDATDTGSIVISPKEIGITWKNTLLTYNGTAQKPTATATKVQTGDTVALSVSGEQTNASASAYTATASFATAQNNYILPSTVTQSFTIANASVKIYTNTTISSVVLKASGKSDITLSVVDSTNKYKVLLDTDPTGVYSVYVNDKNTGYTIDFDTTTRDIIVHFYYVEIKNYLNNAASSSSTIGSVLIDGITVESTNETGKWFCYVYSTSALTVKVNGANVKNNANNKIVATINPSTTLGQTRVDFYTVTYTSTDSNSSGSVPVDSYVYLKNSSVQVLEGTNLSYASSQGKNWYIAYWIYNSNNSKTYKAGSTINKITEPVTLNAFWRKNIVLVQYIDDVQLTSGSTLYKQVEKLAETEGISAESARPTYSDSEYTYTFKKWKFLYNGTEYAANASTGVTVGTILTDTNVETDDDEYKIIIFKAIYTLAYNKEFEVTPETSTYYVEPGAIGTTITVEYRVTKNTGINSLVLVPDFNSTIFEITSITTNDTTNLGAATVTGTAVSGATTKILFETSTTYNSVGDILVTITYTTIADVNGSYTLGFVVEYREESEDAILENTSRSYAYVWDSTNVEEQSEVKVSYVEATVYVRENTPIDFEDDPGIQTDKDGNKSKTLTYNASPRTVGTSGTDIIYSYNGDGTVTVTWFNSENTALASAPTNVGSYKVVISFSATNASAATEDEISVTINAEALTVTIDDKSSAWNENLVTTFTGSVTTGTNYDSLTFTYSLDSSVTKTSPVGVYTDVITGVCDQTNTNYTVSFVDGDYEITLASNSFTTALVTTDRTYNGNAIAVGTKTNAVDYFAEAKYGDVTYKFYTKSGDVYTETSSTPKDAGTYYVKATVAEDATKYAGVESNYEEIIISKLTAALSWTLDQSDLVYSGSAKTLTASVSNLTAGDSCSVTSALTTNCDNINVGSFTYTASALSNSNYELPTNVTSDTKTITAKPITVTASSQTVTYGTSISTDVSKATAATLVSGHSLTAVTLTPSTTNATTNGTITPSAATIKNGEVDVTTNYDITYVDGVLTINKLAVSEPTVSGTYTYTGSEQTVQLLGKESYMSTESSLKGTNADTYTINYTLDDNHSWAEGSDGTITWTINKADYNMDGITFTNDTATYDGTAHSLVIGGTLPTGADNIQVTVSYSGSATNVSDGAQTVTATFATTSTNYNVPTAKTATITITAKEIGGTGLADLIAAIKGSIKEYTGSAITWAAADFTIGSITNQISGDTVCSISAVSAIGTEDYINANGKVTSSVWSYYTDGSVDIKKYYTVTVNASDNYIFTGSKTSDDINVEVFIKQATNSWTTTPAVSSSTSSGVSITNTSVAKFGDNNNNFVGYYSDNTLSTSIEIGAMTAGTTYYSKFAVTETNNYTGLSTSVPFSLGANTNGAIVVYIDGSVVNPVALITDFSKEITYDGLSHYFAKDSAGNTLYNAGSEETGYTVTITSATGAWKNAGEYELTFTLKQTWVWNDSSTGDIVYRLKIKKADLTIKADDNSITYLDAAPTYSATPTGFVNNETLSTYSVSNIGSYISCSYAVSATSASVVGTYDINIADDASTTLANALSNYNLTLTKGTLTVSAKTIGVGSSSTIATKVTMSDSEVTYDTQSHSISISTVTGVSATYTIDGETGNSATSVKRSSGSVTYYSVEATLALTGNDSYGNSYADNYAFENNTNTLSAKLTINPYKITVTADAQSSVYDSNPKTIDSTDYTITATEGTLDAFVLTDSTITALVTKGTNEDWINVGTYTLVPSVTATNYDVTTVNGTYTITQATTTWTTSLTTVDRAYNGNALSKGTSSSNADYFAQASLHDNLLTYKFYTKSGETYTETSATPVTVGTYYVKATLTGTDNYTSLESDYIKIEITKKIITVGTDTDDVVKMSDSEVTYDGSSHSVSISTVTGVTATYTIDGTTGNSKTDVKRGTGDVVESYSVVATLAFTGNDAKGNSYADNYEFESSTISASLKINPKEVTVTATDKTTQYGDTPVSLAYTTNPAENAFYSRDVMTVSLATKTTGTNPSAITLSSSSNAGTYSIVPTVSGTGIKNYAITETPGTYTISKASIDSSNTGSGLKLTVSANNVYYNRSLDYTITASVGGITLTSSAYTVKFYDSQSQEVETPVNADTYTISVTVNETDNYVSDTKTATFAILKVKLDVPSTLTYNKDTVSWTAVTKDIGKTSDETGVTAADIKTGVTLSYKVGEIDCTTAMSYTVSATGTVTITITASDDNYISSSITTTREAYSIEFDDGAHTETSGNALYTDLDSTKTKLSDYATQYRFTGETADEPSDPTITGYTFANWKLIDSEYDFTTTISSNISLVAVWTINTYTITWYNQASKIYEETYNYNEVPSFDTSYDTPTKASDDEYSYTFDGWNTTSDALQTITPIPNVSADATYYAIFSKTGIDYVITYMYSHDGSTYEQYSTTQTVAFGTTITYKTLAEKTWFKTVSWYTDEDRTVAAPTTMPVAKTGLTVYGAYVFDIGTGDVNGDGLVNVDDITLYRRWLVGGYEIIVVDSESEWDEINDKDFDISENVYFLKRVADVNKSVEGSGKLDIRDVSTIRMALVGGFNWGIATGYNITGQEVCKSQFVSTEEELIEAVNSLGIVALNSDIELTAPLQISKNTILYLNGHNITLSNDFEGSYAVIISGNGKVLTIYGNNSSSINTTNIDSVDIFSVVNSGKLVIKGGTYSADENKKLANVGATSTIEIYDGTFVNDINAEATAIVTIYGGTFTNYNPTSKVATGYMSEETALNSGIYNVFKGVSVSNASELTTALNGENVKIILTSDITGSTVEIEQILNSSLILDLGGHVLKIKSFNITSNVSGIEIIVTNGTIEVDSNEEIVILAPNGTVDISNDLTLFDVDHLKINLDN